MTPITEEQKEQIRALFDGYGGGSFDFSCEAREDGYYVTVSQMYYYVAFKDDISVLQGYRKIAETLGCKYGDEVGRDYYSGCETCDYGSKYTVELKFR